MLLFFPSSQTYNKASSDQFTYDPGTFFEISKKKSSLHCIKALLKVKQSHQLILQNLYVLQKENILISCCIYGNNV